MSIPARIAYSGSYKASVYTDTSRSNHSLFKLSNMMRSNLIHHGGNSKSIYVAVSQADLPKDYILLECFSTSVKHNSCRQQALGSFRDHTHDAVRTLSPCHRPIQQQITVTHALQSPRTCVLCPSIDAGNSSACANFLCCSKIAHTPLLFQSHHLVTAWSKPLHNPSVSHRLLR